MLFLHHYHIVVEENMKRTEAQIRQTELLLTLDYLLNYTDEDHPATQQDICRHALDFGLKYDSKATKGNDVRRQRVGECLQFLQYICYKFKDTDQIPFVINSTESGKFYIEEKNHLNEEQIIKVLAAVQNDKYTKNEDTDFLINKLLDSLSNKHNREFYKQELEKENKHVNKYKVAVNKKMRLVNKACREGKCITIIQSHFGRLRPEDLVKMFYEPTADGQVYFGTIDEKIYCRVYRIEEHNNKPYAILIPLNKHGVIFDAIANLNIQTNLSERDLLMDDPDEHRDLDKLFKENNKFLAERYDSLDEYVDKSIMPEKGFAFKTSFYFHYRYLNRVKRSFEECFSRDMPVIKCSSFKINKEQTKRGRVIEVPLKIDKFAIECEPLPKNEFPKYGVVNIEINKKALLSWLWNNLDVAKVVNVVSPSSVNRELGLYILRLLSKYQDDVGDETIQKKLKAHHFINPRRH